MCIYIYKVKIIKKKHVWKTFHTYKFHMYI